MVHISVALCLCVSGLQETLVSLENTMKTHLEKILYFLMIVLTLSFHYILGVYFFIKHFTLFSQGHHKIGNAYMSINGKSFYEKLRVK